MTNDKKLPTSRARRTAMLGGVVAGQAARQVGTKVATVGRSDERKRIVLDRRQADAARALVTALGTMRGAAMKIGQMLSVVDMGLFPEEVREDMQRQMAKLRDTAPTVSFDKMRKVIEEDLGERLSANFAEFDEEPLAAASIGQVYRGRLHDGREVAVKVQYPGVDKAIRADLKNLSMIMRAMKLVMPNMDSAAMAQEIRERIEEELDYELEAQNQRKVARLYRDHPYIVIPGVITRLSGPHVLVTEYFEGMRFEELKEADVAVRDRVAEVVFRFYVGGMYEFGQFSPDPHPGNFLVGDDGRVAFLDFGLYKHVTGETLQAQRAILRAVAETDAERVRDELARGGFIVDTDRVPPETALEYVQNVFWWATADDVIELDPDTATEAMINTINPSAKYFTIARHQAMPPEQTLVLRMLVMIMAALGHLRATGNWHRIAREWIYDDAPSTELGKVHADYLRGRETGLAAV